MSYKNPKLIMALGSMGGFFSLKQVMDCEERGDILRKGALYLVEHRSEPVDKGLILDYKSLGMDLESNVVADGRPLEPGFHFYKGLKDIQHETQEPERPSSVALWRDARGEWGPKGKVYFRDFGEELTLENMLNFQLEKAMEAGYGEGNLLVLILSGWGGDGCGRTLGEALKKGATVLVHNPDEIFYRHMPSNALQTLKDTCDEAEIQRRKYGEEVKLGHYGVFGWDGCEFIKGPICRKEPVGKKLLDFLTDP